MRLSLKLLPAVVIALLLAVLFPSFVAAQSSAARYADDVLRLAPVLAGLFGLGGVGAMITAGLYARENKTESAKTGACFVAACGGIFLCLSLLGISLLSLIGSVVLAAVGIGVCLLIAQS